MSTKVIQRTPSLGLRIRLQPVAASCDCPPAGGCDVLHSYWLEPPSVINEEWGDWIRHESRYDDETLPVDPRNYKIVPPEEGEPPTIVYGFLSGAAVDGVTWAWSGAEAAGVVVRQIGGAVEVSVTARAKDYAQSPRLPVVFTASCGTTEVAWLRLTVYWDAH